jgi:Flp pilus assembly protein TadG
MNTTQSQRRFTKRERRGVAVVEFALTAPIFFLFVLAAFEFGWMNVLRHTADNAAYEGARAAMVPGATAAEATAKANSILGVVRARNAKVTVTPSVITPSTTEITVDVDVPMGSNSLVLPRFTSKTTLHSESTLRTERPSEPGDFSGGTAGGTTPSNTKTKSKGSGGNTGL